jgi:hypothetical protein
MSHRDDALRRIFDATGVSGRLTDDQKRELLAHLDDAVQAKVDAGLPEMDAVGQAFVELGPLKKIVEQYPAGPVAVTPEGGLLATLSRGAALKGLALLALLSFIQAFVTPKFVVLFAEFGLPASSLTSLFLSGISEDVIVATGVLLAALFIAQIVARRKGWTSSTIRKLRISALAVYGVVAVCCATLSVGCGMGVARLFQGLLG